MKKGDHRGAIIGISIIVLWLISLVFLLNWEVDFTSPFTYLFVLVQTHLYTGLFITAHDSMHRAVSRNARVNEWIGRICATLFAFNFYGNLFRKHHLHHRHVATDQDPDYHEGGFWRWYLSFALQYVNFWQILLMAVAYNLLILIFPEKNVALYWMLPSIFSTFQLFYFGTYLPHRGEHQNEHRSKSQKKNHFVAFITCYFFGYHFEHHFAPDTPWWQLPKLKEKLMRNLSAKH